jgi:hypothetical protein
MPDLFARLAARSRGQATLLRPRPDAIYTGRSMVVEDTLEHVTPAVGPDTIDSGLNPQNPAVPLDTPDRLDIADLTRSREPTASSGPAQRAPAPEAKSDERHAAPNPPPPQTPSPAHPPAAGTPAATLRTPEATPPSTARSANRRQRNPAAAGPSTLAQVVAALDAGSPVAVPGAESPLTEQERTLTDTVPVYLDRAVHERDRGAGRGGHDVHVTIGELVIRGAPAAPPPPAPAPASPASPRLTLHDYLRGRQEPT